MRKVTPEELVEAVQTSFRKGCTDGHAVWFTLASLPDEQFTAAMTWVIDSLGLCISDGASEDDATTLSILQNAKKLLASPDNRSIGCLARDAAGHPTHFSGVDAHAFCLVGAVLRESNKAGVHGKEPLDMLRIAAYRVVEGFDAEDSLLLLTDQISFEKIHEVFDAAIAEARRNG